MTKKRKILSGLSIISPVVVSALSSISCVIVPNKTIKLNNSQIETIKKSINFKLTDEGKKKYKDKFDELYDLLKKKNNEYVQNEKFYQLQYDKELKKYISLSFPDVNSLFSGHFLKIKFSYNQSTKTINLLWKVGCSSYPNEGNGIIPLDTL